MIFIEIKLLFSSETIEIFMVIMKTKMKNISNNLLNKITYLLQIYACINIKNPKKINIRHISANFYNNIIAELKTFRNSELNLIETFFTTHSIAFSETISFSLPKYSFRSFFGQFSSS